MTLNKTEVVELLRTACAETGSQAAWARAKGISAAHVNDVLHGARDPGPAICRALGVEREDATYRRKERTAK